MLCSSCGHDLRSGARFCDACGRPVAEAAPDRRPPTPAHLAEKIRAVRGRIDGERKQVTVLFADVKGSMELTEQIDPEDWRRIVERFVAILSDGVHRFEGTVTQFTGDGIMALFGAPLAHEDHAQRACAAALHLDREIRRYARELRLREGLAFSVRMGLNSGDVVVGTIGDDLHMDYTALGATVGLAQRMEQLAEPGTVYVTEHTARLVDGFFRLDELGPFGVKGLREPVRVFVLEGAGPLRTRLDRSRARGLSHFVGRDAESTLLDDALRDATAGQGRIVGVVAEAGVGKSRLCHEFVERARARGVAIHRAHCVPHGALLPLLPIQELLRSFVGTTDADDGDTARRKIAGTVLLLDAELTESLPLLFELLGVPDPARTAERVDPEARQRRLCALFTRLIQARSRREPSILWVDDLHWIDAGSLVFLERLAEIVPETATLLLTTARPEVPAPWTDAAAYRAVALAPLGAAAVDALLADVLGDDPSLAGLADLVRARTAGNPFFIEEVVQALVEGGTLVGAKGAYRLVGSVAGLVVPPTVQAILAARIDRLPPREKAVLQSAAVIGKEFGEPVLRAVSGHADAEIDAALAALARAQLVYESAVHPEREYSFQHPLTHEVAYRSQLGARRATMHAAVARALVALAPERQDERAALLAHHWEEAGAPLEAAQWSRRAAEWAMRSDLAEAAGHWRRVRTLLARVPDDAQKTRLTARAAIEILGLGWRLGMPADEADAVFAEGAAAAERTGDVGLRASLLDTYGTVRGMAGHIAEAVDRTREAMLVADASGDPRLRIGTRVALVEAQYMAGDLRDALEMLRQARALAATVPDGAGFAPSIWIVMMHGWILFDAGRPDESAHELAQAIALAREHEQHELLGWSHELRAYVVAFHGDAEQALDHARRALAIAVRSGNAFSRTSAYDALGCAHLARGDWASAAHAFSEALAILAARRTAVHWEPRLLAELAEAHLGAGDVAAAATAAERAAAGARALATKVTECRALLTLGRVLLRRDGGDDRARVQAALERALALVAVTGAALYEPGIRVELAELARLRGNGEGRRRELAAAEQLLGTMRSPR